MACPATEPAAKRIRRQPVLARLVNRSRNPLSGAGALLVILLLTLPSCGEDSLPSLATDSAAPKPGADGTADTAALDATGLDQSQPSTDTGEADGIIDVVPDTPEPPDAGLSDGLADASDAIVPDAAPGDAAETLANQPPTIQIMAPKAGDVLTKGIVAHFEAKVADPDDAPETLVVVWTSNLATAPLAFAKANILGISAFDTAVLPAGVQTLTAQVSDAGGAKAKAQVMMLVNSAPGAPVIAITPPKPIAAEALVAQIAVPAMDADRKSSELVYAFQWLKSGVATPFSAATLPAGITKRGEAWKVLVTASDPYAAGSSGYAEVIIANALPTAPAVAITPTTVDQLTTVTCDVTKASQDSDGDAVTYKFSWLIGGSIVTEGKNASIVVGSLAVGGKIIKQGDSLQCRATPNDGISDGAAGTSAAVAIGATDVCGSGANPCSANALCANTETAQPVCTCKPGFDGDGKTCVEVTCSDGKKNGDETGPDCGGTACGGCANGLGCSSGADCASTHCDAGSKCVACLAASDCPGSENGCQLRTCTAGVCGLDVMTAGTVLATQMTGDCKTAQCDGIGGVKQVVLDSDLPDDGLYCTVDTCKAGEPANTPMAVGTACAQNGGIQCNSAGACVQTCTVVQQCPGTDTECETIICSDGLCGVTFAAAGKVVSQQTTGDCKQNRCNGVGGVIGVPANGDFPNDGNACTIDSCTAGVPANPPQLAGLPCDQNGGNVCDGKGACIGCLFAKDCPGFDTECKLRACTAGQCGETMVQAGKVTTEQAPGDCKQNQCNGSGGIAAVPLGTDVAFDGNACTYDVCNEGTPAHPPALAGTTCSQDGGYLCNGQGACVQCLVGSDCPAPVNACQEPICSAGVCSLAFLSAGTPVANQGVGDCKKQLCDGSGGVATVIDNSDLPDDGKQCTSDSCKMGSPSNLLLAYGTPCTQDGGILCDGAGTCVQCTTPADCPGSDTLCQARTCKNHICGIDVVPAGTLVGSQLPGDCKSNQCDGFGNTVWDADAKDVPVDGNPCTDDVCSSGVASNPPSAAGTACNVSNGHVCNGAGACIGCSTAADCPGADSDCKTRTCTAGACGVTVVAAGTVLANQTPGDCAVAKCDGAGGVQAYADPSDLPIDGKICTLDLCTGTTPSNPPVAAGATCNQGGGNVCNGGGTCVQCNDSGDCPGQDNECQQRSCTANQCSSSYVAAGTLLKEQTAGDCRIAQCSGNGGIVSNVLDTDLPIDGNECTQDICWFGNPMNPPVAGGVACTGGVCSGGGTCVQCTSPGTCPGIDNECGSRTCSAGKCGMNLVPKGQATAIQTPGDCKESRCNGAGAVESVALDSDIGYDTNDCTQDVCSAGVLSHPFAAASSSCSQNGGTACDGAGVCVQCAVAADCGTGNTDCMKFTCTAHKCGIANTAAGTPTSNQIPGDCRQYQCDGAGNIVSIVLPSDVPNDENTCTNDTCKDGLPTFTGVGAGTACTQNGGKWCDGNGSCVECANATTCPGTDTECQVRMCSNGACVMSKMALGTPVGQQTQFDCKRNVCDGKGSVISINDDLDQLVDGNECTLDSCTAGTPSNPPSAAGTACVQNGGKKCDGAGACVACIAGTDCPGTDTTCQWRTCIAHVCGVAIAATGLACNDNGGKVCDAQGQCAQCNTAADCGAKTDCATPVCTPTAGVGMCTTDYVAWGTKTSKQKSGDCAEEWCDGAGGTLTEVTSSDSPCDDNDCTQDSCTGNVPTITASNPGTPCKSGGGKLCDGSGTCVLCNLDSNCPEGSTCVNHACTGTACSDGVKNGKETGIDCGGDCGVCPAVVMLASSSSLVMGASWTTAQASWTTQEIPSGTASAAALAGNAVDGAVGLIQRAGTNNVQSLKWSGASWSVPADVAPTSTGVDGPSLSGTSCGVAAAWRVSPTLYSFNSYGTAWLAANEAIGAAGSSVAGDIATTGTDATFVYNDAGTIRAINRSAVWGAPVAIATGAAATSAPRIVKMNGGAATDVMVVYADAGAGNPAWFVTRSNGVWAAKKALDATALLADRPSLVAGPSGTAMVALRKADSKVYVSFYVAGIWSVPAAVTGAINVTSAPSITTGITGATAELAYIAGGKAYHARYVGSAWTTPAVVGTTTGLTFVTLARTR